MAGHRNAKNVFSTLSARVARVAKQEELYAANAGENALQGWVGRIEAEFKALETEFEDLGKILQDLREMVGFARIQSHLCNLFIADHPSLRSRSTYNK